MTISLSSFIKSLTGGFIKPTITKGDNMMARKPKTHGHKGNTKNWQVQYRDNAAERAEKKEFGCTDVDKWEVSPNLRQTQCDRLTEKLERMRYEIKIINLNLTTERVLR